MMSTTVAEAQHAVVVDTTESRYARLKPVPVTAVKLADSFWAPRLKLIREVTLAEQYEQMVKTGRLDNFRRAAGAEEIPFRGFYFNDSDVYKWIESVSWALAGNDDPKLLSLLDEVIGLVESAQQSDGYLNTYFMFERVKERWTNLKDMHELYCAGHFIQAALAHHRVTGSDRLLRVARKLADNIDGIFGRGKRFEAAGHEEIEMALVELSRETGEQRYLDLARVFVEARGQGASKWGEYHQTHKPFHEQDQVVGHAVRAMYLYAGAADVLAETGAKDVEAALGRLWTNMATRRMYVTGGLGARHQGEAFGRDFELPNETAYTETCAAIGSVMWNWRMLALNGDARYADMLELVLYNAVISGFSLDCRSYFYVNPLRDGGGHRRQPWFECACCPSNVTRTLAALPGYFFSVSEKGAWIHLYAMAAGRVKVPGCGEVGISLYTNYPWEGNVRVEIDGQGEFTLFLRIPAWCESNVQVKVNGKAWKGKAQAGSYAAVRRTWKSGDTVELDFPMRVRRLVSHPRLVENTGQVALMRGPLVYCLEGVDHAGFAIHDMVLSPADNIAARYRPDLLGGVTVLEGAATAAPLGNEWSDSLYRSERASKKSTRSRRVEFMAVPYFSWANRAPGPMQVWLRSR